MKTYRDRQISRVAVGQRSTMESGKAFRSSARVRPGGSLKLCIQSLILSFNGRIIVAMLAGVLLAGSLTAQSDSLSHYLEEGSRRNAGVQSAFALMQAALRRVPQAGALEDPQLEIGVFLQPMTLVEGRQAAEFKLMQMFPWFGVRKAARTEAHHMAQMSYEQFREVRDKLWQAISVQWFNLCRLQETLRYNREQRDLLLRLEALALRRMEAPVGSSPAASAMPAASMGNAPAASGAPASMGGMSGMGGSSTPAPQQTPPPAAMPNMSGGGASGMTDVLNIRMELAETEFAIESLASEITAEKAAFNALLNREPNEAISLPDSIVAIPFLWNDAAIPALIRQNNPMLAMAGEEAKAYKAKEDMDRLMGMPMLGIGLQYMLINRLPEAEPMDMEGSPVMNTMNGKDMLMPMISVTIPLYRNKYKARQLEDRFMRQAALSRFDETLNQLTAELGRSRHKLADATRRLNLYQRQTALAETACNLAAQSFASGAGSLADAIQAQRRLLDYKLKAAEAIADYNTTVANIKTLISSNETE